MTVLTQQECFTVLKELTNKMGAGALQPKWLTKNGYEKLYKRIRTLGLSMLSVAKMLNMCDEYKRVLSYSSRKWTSEEIDRVAESLVQQHGYIPTQVWLQANGLSGFVRAVTQYANGLNDARKKLYSVQFTLPKSRDGKIWDSWAEASLANFFWSREIEFDKGSLYPQAYAELSGRSYGRYDMEFLATKEPFRGKLVFIEIWGDMYGKAAEKYAETRTAKEAFHKNDPFFLGIHYKAAYDEKKLDNLFEMYIGLKQPSQFASEVDRLVKPVGWSRLDQVLKMSELVCSNMNNGLLPPHTWFVSPTRKRSQWELKSWRGFVLHVQLIGGFPKLRQLLQQKLYFRQWTRDLAIQEYAAMYQDEELWPSQIRYKLRRQDQPLTKEDTNLAARASRAEHAKMAFKLSEPEIRKLAIGLLPENLRSTAMPIERSLPKGIQSERGRYRATIQLDKKTVTLSTFKTVEEAVTAKQSAEEQKQAGTLHLDQFRDNIRKQKAASQ